MTDGHQLGLGLGITTAPRRLARTADPAPSHDAAKALATTGRLSLRRRETLLALATYRSTFVPDAGAPTSWELAGGDAAKHYSYSRRLPELREGGYVLDGPVRADRITGNAATTWTITAAGRRAVG